MMVVIGKETFSLILIAKFINRQVSKIQRIFRKYFAKIRFNMVFFFDWISSSFVDFHASWPLLLPFSLEWHCTSTIVSNWIVLYIQWWENNAEFLRFTYAYLAEIRKTAYQCLKYRRSRKVMIRSCGKMWAKTQPFRACVLPRATFLICHQITKTSDSQMAFFCPTLLKCDQELLRLGSRSATTNTCSFFKNRRPSFCFSRC